MQPIQWFPGHMTKALRMMEENIKLCDGIIYVLDARAPFACINFKLNELFNNKPVLYLLNKIDMIEARDADKLRSAFISDGKRVLTTVGTSQKDGKAVYKAIIDMFKDKIESKAARGIKKTLRVMVCGIPNTGKSSVINSLSGKRQAATGDKAGVTKGKQWIKLENIELLDTPGTMPPSFENQTYAHHLAYIGAINDDILDKETLCLDFIEELSSLYPEVLMQKYGVENGTPIEVYENICKKRGFLIRGGEYDYSRCAKAVFDDFRKQRLGLICLEREKI